MKMKKIKILGKSFDIKMVDNSEEAGRVHFDYPTIFINSNMDKQQQNETVLHEVVHALSAFLCLDLDEKQVVVLSNGLYAVLQDNGIGFNVL